MDNQSMDLTSLNFYPHAGHFEFNGHVATTATNRTENSAGIITNTSLTQYYTSFGFGVAHALRVSVNETILWDQVGDTLNAKNVESMSASSGPSNPSLLLSWRYLEDTRNGFSGDLTLSVTPSFGPKVNGDGSINKTGNNLSGGWVEDPSAAFFWRWGANHAEIQAAFTHNDATETVGSLGTSHARSYWSPIYTFTDRLHLTENQFLQSSVAYTPAVKHDSTSEAGVVTATQNHPSTSFTAMFGYRPEPEILLEAIANWRYSSSTVDVESGSSSTESDTKNKNVTITLALLHQF